MFWVGSWVWHCACCDCWDELTTGRRACDGAYMYRRRGGKAEAIRLGARSNSFACVGVRGWARDSGGKWVVIDG